MMFISMLNQIPKLLIQFMMIKLTANKSKLKRMFMSGMKKRLNSRVLLNNFIKRVA